MRPGLPVVVALTLTGLLAGAPLGGQDRSRSDGDRAVAEVRVALMKHGTGADPCGPGGGFSAGGALGTSGPWVLEATAEALVSWWIVCDGSLDLAEYGDRTVEVWGETKFLFAPRLAVHLGRAVRLGDVRLTGTVGWGLIRTVTDFGVHGDPGGGGDRVKDAAWKPWYGGTVSLESLWGGLAAQLEVGRHRVPRRYYALPEDGGGLLHEFTVGRVLARLGIAIPIWSDG